MIGFCLIKNIQTYTSDVYGLDERIYIIVHHARLGKASELHNISTTTHNLTTNLPTMGYNKEEILCSHQNQ